MKYGDTLRQRSVPEWGHYNIDYDYLKDLIKHHTTPGTNKAISIPGQGESTELAFRNTFLEVLQTQHDRINLFVRSKSGEIERRLQHIGQNLEQLRAKHGNYTQSARLPARTVERYAKIDADVTRAGEEIRSLSRFQAVQRTGFTKILKKYKRWTDDKGLRHDFEEHIMSQPDSLFQLDLSFLLDQYVDVLSNLRSVFDNEGIPAAYAGSTNARSTAAHILKTLETGDEVDFDLALTTVPLGSQGKKSTYWVHCDHIVELQVLLLQQMCLFLGKTKSLSRSCSSHVTPGRRNSSVTTFERYLSNDDDVAQVVLDHAETLAIQQNASTIGSSEEAQGSIAMKAAGNIRCFSSGRAAVIVCTESNAQRQPAVNTKVAHVERTDLRKFLDSSLVIPNPEMSESQSEENETIRSDNLLVRQWLMEHRSVKPIAGVVSKRNRFSGLQNNSSGGIWATLDSDVYMKKSLVKDLESDDWPSTARSKSTKFPHAILEIRHEGAQAASLIDTLDQSHLVERVRGFSIEAHTLWICCKPVTMSQPLWVPLLEKDIRKLPEPVSRRDRKGKGSSISVSQTQNSPPYTSASNTSYEGQSSPIARNTESSATSAQEYIGPPPLRAFGKKHRKPYAEYPPPIVHVNPEPEAQRYWNEYDDPENEESGYYIYVDPDAPVNYPGQEMIKRLTQITKNLFGMWDGGDVKSLSAIEDASTDDEDTADESPITPSRDYGTLPASRPPNSHERYFSTIFGSLRDPHRDVEILNEHRTLLSELEARQHSTEVTKLRFYSTCLIAAISIDVILGLMTITSRKKVRGAVDIGVLFGTSVTLVLCFVALLSMKTRNERLSWVHRGAVLSIAMAVMGFDGLLLLWALGI